MEPSFQAMILERQEEERNEMASGDMRLLRKGHLEYDSLQSRSCPLNLGPTSHFLQMSCVLAIQLVPLGVCPAQPEVTSLRLLIFSRDKISSFKGRILLRLASVGYHFFWKEGGVLSRGVLT